MSYFDKIQSKSFIPIIEYNNYIDDKYCFTDNGYIVLFRSYDNGYYGDNYHAYHISKYKYIVYQNGNFVSNKDVFKTIFNTRTKFFDYRFFIKNNDLAGNYNQIKPSLEEEIINEYKNIKMLFKFRQEGEGVFKYQDRIFPCDGAMKFLENKFGDEWPSLYQYILDYNKIISDEYEKYLPSIDFGMETYIYKYVVLFTCLMYRDDLKIKMKRTRLIEERKIKEQKILANVKDMEDWILEKGNIELTKIYFDINEFIKKEYAGDVEKTKLDFHKFDNYQIILKNIDELKIKYDLSHDILTLNATRNNLKNEKRKLEDSFRELLSKYNICEDIEAIKKRQELEVIAYEKLEKEKDKLENIMKEFSLKYDISNNIESLIKLLEEMKLKYNLCSDITELRKQQEIEKSNIEKIKNEKELLKNEKDLLENSINKLQSERKSLTTDNNNIVCSICQDKLPNILLMDCKHLCICEDCHIQMLSKSNIILCPICRTANSNTMKIYI